MMKMPYSILEVFMYCVASIMIVFLGVLVPQFSFKTADDTALLSHYLMQPYTGSGKVLGASDRVSGSLCPIERPIVGWVSYTGDKILATKLPLGEEPSVCFATYEDAFHEGFVIE